MTTDVTDKITTQPATFEIGKYYRHTGGSEIAVLGELNTTLYGLTLIVEEAGVNGFKPVGRGPEATVNWVEITQEEWLKNFS